MSNYNKKFECKPNLFEGHDGDRFLEKKICRLLKKCRFWKLQSKNICKSSVCRKKLDITKRDILENRFSRNKIQESSSE